MKHKGEILAKKIKFRVNYIEYHVFGIYSTLFEMHAHNIQNDLEKHSIIIVFLK